MHASDSPLPLRERSGARVRGIKSNALTPLTRPGFAWSTSPTRGEVTRIPRNKCYNAFFSKHQTPMSKQEYNAAAIEVLTGLDPVRRRPGMYTDTTRPNH